MTLAERRPLIAGGTHYNATGSCATCSSLFIHTPGNTKEKEMELEASQHRRETSMEEVSSKNHYKSIVYTEVTAV